MVVNVTPETAKKLNDLAATSGRAPEDIVEDALAGYLEEVTSIRKTLDSCYDDLKSTSRKTTSMPPTGFSPTFIRPSPRSRDRHRSDIDART